MTKYVVRLVFATVLALSVVLIGLYATLSTLQRSSPQSIPSKGLSDEQKFQELADLSSSTTVPASQQLKILGALQASTTVSKEDKAKALQGLH